MKKLLLSAVTAATLLTSVAGQAAGISDAIYDTYVAESAQGNLYEVSDHTVSQLRILPLKKARETQYSVKGKTIALSETALKAGQTTESYVSSGVILKPTVGIIAGTTTAKLGNCDVPFNTVSRISLKPSINHAQLVNAIEYCSIPALSGCKVTNCLGTVKKGEIASEWVIGKDKALSLFKKRQTSESAQSDADALDKNDAYYKEALKALARFKQSI